MHANPYPTLPKTPLFNHLAKFWANARQTAQEVEEMLFRPQGTGEERASQTTRVVLSSHLQSRDSLLPLTIPPIKWCIPGLSDSTAGQTYSARLILPTHSYSQPAGHPQQAIGWRVGIECAKKKPKLPSHSHKSSPISIFDISIFLQVHRGREEWARRCPSICLHATPWASSSCSLHTCTVLSFVSLAGS